MTTTFDITVIASIWGAVAVLAVPIIFLFKLYWRILKLCYDTNTSKKERKVLLRGVVACLRGIQELGGNGPVTSAIEDIDNFIDEQLHDINIEKEK